MLGLEYEMTENYMSNGVATIRELNASELDLVGGGLSLGVGATVDAGAELKAVSGLVDQVGGLVEGLAGGALKAVGGLAGGALGKV